MKTFKEFLNENREFKKLSAIAMKLANHLFDNKNTTASHSVKDAINILKKDPYDMDYQYKLTQVLDRLSLDSYGKELKAEIEEILEDM